MASAPACIFFNYDEAGKTLECAAALGVGKGKEVKGWEKYAIPAGKVLQVEYFGDYKKSMAAHDAIKKYIAEKGLTKVMAIEEYMNDPMTEKDTAKWQTNIYYIIK